MFKSKYQQDRRFKIRIPSRLRKILISAFILLIIFLLAGTAYTLFASSSVKQTAQPSTEDKAVSSAPHIYKPPKPGANAAEGVAIVSLISPVKAGANSSIAISTNIGSTCTISVIYDKVASKDSGLVSKHADDYGNADWTWTVDKSAPAGKWPVKVTCTYNKRTGVVIGDLVVTK